jgi:hypothetical protein
MALHERHFNSSIMVIGASQKLNFLFSILALQRVAIRENESKAENGRYSTFTRYS